MLQISDWSQENPKPTGVPKKWFTSTVVTMGMSIWARNLPSLLQSITSRVGLMVSKK
ncbi:MAG: hypothetical protein Ct9H300mP30_1170 [Methanobacteriota archaeon]|nr:MAG: hypothetical protein Ct9H300mP30_1170 [Euryarchaeota archaeon]